MRNLVLAILMVVFLVGLTKAQSEESKEFSLVSWKKGTKIVTNQKLRILLTSKESYQTEIVGVSGKRYRFSVEYKPVSSQPRDYWVLGLHEILLIKSQAKEILSDDLLSVARSGTGGDDFPRETYLRELYPNEQAKVFVNGRPFVDGDFNYYPFRAVRKFRVENFELIAKVENYKLNEKDDTKIDSIEIIIEFRNICKESKNQANTNCISANKSSRQIRKPVFMANE